MRLFIRDLQKYYGKNAVFRNIGYSFEEGTIYGLVGKKGSGKTTLFDCISGEVNFKGSIELEDQRKDLVLPGLDTVSVSFQTPMIPEFLTAFEYIRFYLDVHKEELTEVYSAEEYLRLVGIPMSLWGELIKNYSMDYKNRLQLVGLFISGSPIILMDEPCHDMVRADWYHIRELLEAFTKGHIIILATESEEVASVLCDEVIHLENGNLTEVRSIMRAHDGAVQMTIDDIFEEEEEEQGEPDWLDRFLSSSDDEEAESNDASLKAPTSDQKASDQKTSDQKILDQNVKSMDDTFMVNEITEDE